MVRVLVAGLVAMVIAVVIGPQFIAWLRRQSVGQQIREEGPKHHVVKQGTPTMGGLLILFAAVLPFVVVALYTIPGLTVMLATLALRDDRVRRRLPQGAQAAVARALRPLEAAPAGRRDRWGGLGHHPRSATWTRRSTSP